MFERGGGEGKREIPEQWLKFSLLSRSTWEKKTKKTREQERERQREGAGKTTEHCKQVHDFIEVSVLCRG